MVKGELKRRIDALWTEFWQSGITNPLTVIEQITFLMYARLLDINEARDENRKSGLRSHLHGVSGKMNSIYVGHSFAVWAQKRCSPWCGTMCFGISSRRSSVGPSSTSL